MRVYGSVGRDGEGLGGCEGVHKVVVQIGKSAEEVQYRPGRVLEWLMQHKHRGTGRDCAGSGDLPQQQWRSC